MPPTAQKDEAMQIVTFKKEKREGKKKKRREMVTALLLSPCCHILLSRPYPVTIKDLNTDM